MHLSPAPVKPCATSFLYLTYSCVHLGSGLGRGVALAYAESGTAGVVFADKNLAAVETAAQGARNVATNPDFQAIVVQVDVTKQEEVDEMVAKAINAFGRLDYAFNSAGVSHFSTSYSPVVFPILV